MKTRQPEHNIHSVRDIVERVAFRDRWFVVVAKGDGFLLQMRYKEEDVQTGELAEQHTRKWYISRYATESEIVQTALKCVLTSQEHIGREHFLYRGVKVYGPHLNVNDLIRLVEMGELDEQRRTPPGPDVGPRKKAKQEKRVSARQWLGSPRRKR